MKEAILVALEVYYMGFIISILIAALIKGIQLVIHSEKRSGSTARGGV